MRTASVALACALLSASLLASACLALSSAWATSWRASPRCALRISTFRPARTDNASAKRVLLSLIHI